jgi:hypothetical protein
MSFFSRLAGEIEQLSPYVIILVVYLLVVAVVRQRRAKPHPKPVPIAILEDTFHAAAALGSIGIVHWVMANTVGDDAILVGVTVKTIFDFGHLAVILDWLIRCLIRMLD